MAVTCILDDYRIVQEPQQYVPCQYALWCQLHGLQAIAPLISVGLRRVVRIWAVGPCVTCIVCLWCLPKMWLLLSIFKWRIWVEVLAYTLKSFFFLS